MRGLPGRIVTAFGMALRRAPDPRAGRLVLALGGVALVVALALNVPRQTGVAARIEELYLPLALLSVGGSDLVSPARRGLSVALRLAGLAFALATLLTSF